jgi:hypothetical protein
MRGAAPVAEKIPLAELIALGDYGGAHGPVFMRSLGPRESVSGIDPHGKTHGKLFQHTQYGIESEMIPLDKELKKSPETPIEDLTLEYAKEDVEIEGRKPDLGEIEEDASEL